jgi:hypothetical protein
MTQFQDFYSIGHGSEAACAAAIAQLLAGAEQPGEIEIDGPFPGVKVLANGDEMADPPVAPTVADDGCWYFNARSRGEALPGDWLSPPATPLRQWG